MLTNKFRLFSQKIFLWLVRGREYNARCWSNERLKYFCSNFSGRIINISGGDDSDKQGDVYRNYFNNKTDYYISNFSKLYEVENEIEFDLRSRAIDINDTGKYDVVFTHTVLEHVYELDAAINNICSLSRDIIITVVPFIQSYHRDHWYDDFWRFTPVALFKAFELRGFKTLHVDWNDDPIGNIYILHIASKNPDRWGHVFKSVYTKLHGPGSSRDKLLYSAQESSHAKIHM